MSQVSSGCQRESAFRSILAAPMNQSVRDYLKYKSKSILVVNCPVFILKTRASSLDHGCVSRLTNFKTVLFSLVDFEQLIPVEVSG